MFVTKVRIGAEVGGYAHKLPVVHHLRRRGGLEFRAPITVIVGDNGTGKSTLLEAIAAAMGINPEGGTTSLMRFNYAGTESTLHHALTVSRKENPQLGVFLRGETFFNFSSEHDATTAFAPKLHPRSHGQSVQQFLDTYLKKRGLFIFDEPESGLSALAQLALLGQIHRATQLGSQFIIATHSVILPGIPGADIYQISDEGIIQIDFDEVESIAVVREFLADPYGVADYVCEMEE